MDRARSWAASRRASSSPRCQAYATFAASPSKWPALGHPAGTPCACARPACATTRRRPNTAAGGPRRADRTPTPEAHSPRRARYRHPGSRWRSARAGPRLRRTSPAPVARAARHDDVEVDVAVRSRVAAYLAATQEDGTDSRTSRRRRCTHRPTKSTVTTTTAWPVAVPVATENWACVLGSPACWWGAATIGRKLNRAGSGDEGYGI
jgi:hypothetical protein